MSDTTSGREAPDSDGASASSDALGAPPLIDPVAHRLLQARVLDRLVGDVDATSDSAPLRVGRFVIERELGSGGMGTIYSGWDEQLHRQVALKFLRRVGAEPEQEHRLFREAQALAQLSDPNVVPIYDVGRHEGRVWLAMEYVSGQTLRAWAKEPRSQRERLDVWMAAGRGLAAIHEAGLVHRDIKPDNVMIGDDGRVKIVDFGLVRIIDGAPESSSQAGLSTRAEWADELTARNGFVGTPAYAAPEQLHGGTIDARSDQFSLCVSLWEALCGARPSRGRDPGGEVAASEGPELPATLRRALSRGLRLDPRERFDNVAALLDALAPARRRWVVPTVVGSVAAAVGAVAGVMMLGQPAPTPAVAVDPCAQAGAPLDSVWPDSPLRSTSALSDDVITEAQAVVDVWAEDWRRTARQACEEVHVRQLRSPSSLDRRGMCLDRRLAGLAALRAGLDQGRVQQRSQLVELMGRLGEPADCLEESVLSTEVAPVPPGHVHDVADVRTQLVELGVGLSDRTLAERITRGEALYSRALELGWRPLIGEVALELGHLHTLASDAPAARGRLGQALDVAQHTRDVETAALAWSGLHRVERALAMDPRRAKWAWQRHAALYDDLSATIRQRARLSADRGQGFALAAQRPEAEQALREALQLYETMGPAAASEQAATLRQLAYLVMDIGRADEALALLQRARTLRSGDGADTSAHATSQLDGSVLLNEAIALHHAGDNEAARAKAQRALELAIGERGPQSERAARAHVTLAAICSALGDKERQRVHAELADKASLAAVGPDHALRTDVLTAVGTAAFSAGRLDDTRIAFEGALDVVRRAMAEDSLEVAQAESNLAYVLVQLDQAERARELAVHCLPILERELPSGHPRIAMARSAAGQ